MRRAPQPLFFCNALRRYVLCCPTRALCEASPYVESFKRADVEVLYTYTPFDELVHSRMPDVGGKPIKLIDHATLPENLAPKRDDNHVSLDDDAVKELCAFFKAALGSRVLDVTATSRLFDSPCAVSGHENAGTRQMRKMFMARAGAAAMATPPVTMLINPHHPTIVALSRCSCTPCVGAGTTVFLPESSSFTLFFPSACPHSTA